MDDMVPPALSKVREDMLPRQFNNLVHHTPNVEQNVVSHHKRGEEPVSEVDSIVMVKIVPEILKSYLTVIVIGVMPF